ncbi:hypothetical protein F511_37090 [Dorcoceras hygrometricum]|uniref:Uncharacterized protein n=1 Tax=Dorcoceras hygrometricum TaxID=472368 RepID=A0A2Z7CL63_9LAMI|nr:hypothetical protein F511_37090 [Dorcoceras hygrometricum]
MTSALLIERYRDSATMMSGYLLEEAMSSRDDVSNQQLSQSYQQLKRRFLLKLLSIDIVRRVTVDEAVEEEAVISNDDVSISVGGSCDEQ